MARKCTHPVGYIPPTVVHAKDWNQKLAQFVEKVFDFNIRGQRDQINHPGFITEFTFCPECGTPIDRAGLLTYPEAFDLHKAGLSKS
jgi:hypothetical protein